MDRILALADRALTFWQKFQEFFDINGDAILLVFTAAIIYRIFHGPNLGPYEAACYGTCVTCFAATKIKKP